MKKNISIIIFVGLIVVVFLWVLIKTNFDQKHLISNQVKTLALITDVTIFPKGDGLYIHYEFYAKNTKTNNKKRIFIQSKYIDVVKKNVNDKSCIAIYDKVNPDNNDILLLTEDFKTFDVSIPDTFQTTVQKLDSLVTLN